MTITYLPPKRLGEMVELTVVSDLVGHVYYHWWSDGSYLQRTETPVLLFYVAPGEQLRIACIDTLDPDFDWVANAPPGAPSRRTLWWVRSIDTSHPVDYYRVEEQQDGGDWEFLDRVPATSAWTYAYTTGRLSDLTTYAWRIIPVDRLGNEGDPLLIDAEDVVRIPDGVSFVVTFDEDTTQVTFAGAA